VRANYHRAWFRRVWVIIAGDKILRQGGWHQDHHGHNSGYS
jgi:hypothetical protein